MDKNYTFDVSGHVFRRIFSYTEEGIYHTMTLPGGAAVIQQMLSHRGLAEYKALDDTFRGEHLELQRFEDRQSRKAYYAIARRIGITPGKEISPPPADAPYAIIWDEGYGGITPPAGTPILWASNKALPAEETFNTVAEHCFLMLDANTLRDNGAMINRQISWERTVTELIRQIKNNPRLSYLAKASHLLITFAEDGAVYMKRGGRHPVLVLTHGGGENILREKIKGRIEDTFAVMVASAALQFRPLVEGKEPFRVMPVLKAAENLMEAGYSIDRLCRGDFLIPDEKTETGQTGTPFEIPDTLGGSVTDPDFWCISNNVGNKRIFDMACEYVQQGAKAIEGLPRLSFGALTTIDRWEIESYQNIRNLITGYASSDNVRPLSIAVFGAPGSGKSFGVTQIALNILPGRVEKLEFNVSQFTGKADLDAAFQKVRDVTLVGKLPLVFFDEFDSDRDGMPLGWIKSFLMPMQDGKFKDDSGEHPLGKCILVFAGGTSASFEAFIRPMQSDDLGFKNIKGPDFVSRLRGTINVLGPNRVNDTDNNYILRRALLLRSLSERKLKMKKGEPPMDKNVLRAMLLVPEYKHGARSMEA
ncbi:MAG: hypothetical protein LBQ78_04690, partial [Tannerellaceae bacterium]|nr:hypothetical protein [Tannerellaceae bacterium]